MNTDQVGDVLPFICPYHLFDVFISVQISLICKICVQEHPGFKCGFRSLVKIFLLKSGSLDPKLNSNPLRCRSFHIHQPLF